MKTIYHSMFAYEPLTKFLNQFNIENQDINNLVIEITNSDHDYCDDITINIGIMEKILTPGYKSRHKNYIKDIKQYEKDLKEYQIKLAEYELAIKKREEKTRAQKIRSLKQELKKLENQAKIEKENVK